MATDLNGHLDSVSQALQFLQNGGIDDGCALIEVGNRVSIEITGSQTHNVGDDEVKAVAELILAAPSMARLLAALEPHLDAIICYASTMGEHEPNAIAADVRGWLGHLRDVGALPPALRGKAKVAA